MSSICAAAIAKLPAAADGSRGVIINVASVAALEVQKAIGVRRVERCCGRNDVAYGS